MGYGLIDIASQTRQQALQGLSDVSERENQREIANQQLKDQRKQGQMSMAGMGAGMGVQGLADGFLAGFNTADAAISRNKEMGLRDAALQQQVKDSDLNFGLRQADFDYGKEKDQREFGYKQERDKVGDQLWGQKLDLDKQQVGISRAGLGLRAQELGMRQKEYNYKMMQEERNQRLQNEMPVVQTFYKQLEETGKVDPELYSQISKDNPLNPGRFFGKEAINNVMEINQVMPKVLFGDVNYNDHKVIKLMNSVLSTDIKRGEGETDPQTGKKIVSKELGHIGLSEDGEFIIPGIKVKYDDGSTALKPMTEFGFSDSRDSQVAHIPISNMMDKIRGYSQMVGQLNQPNRAEFLNNMINPPDKSAARESPKGSAETCWTWVKRGPRHWLARNLRTSQQSMLSSISCKTKCYNPMGMRLNLRQRMTQTTRYSLPSTSRPLKTPQT